MTIDTYKLTLTGADDGFADAVIPMESFSYRQKNGTESRLSVVAPYQYATSIDARPNGELIVDWYRDGSLVEELARANLTGVASGEGWLNRSLQIEGAKQTTWTPPEQATTLTNVIYRGTNQSDGRWNYRLSAPIAGLKAGWTVAYGSHEFTVGEILHQVNSGSHTVHLSEAETSAGGSSGGAACLTTVTIPQTISDGFENACYFAAQGYYYANMSFTLSVEQTVGCIQTSSPALEIYLTRGEGNTAYDADGNVVDGPMLSGSGFIATLPPGTYNVQVHSADDAATYTFEFTYR